MFTYLHKTTINIEFYLMLMLILLVFTIYMSSFYINSEIVINRKADANTLLSAFQTALNKYVEIQKHPPDKFSDFIGAKQKLLNGQTITVYNLLRPGSSVVSMTSLKGKVIFTVFKDGGTATYYLNKLNVSADLDF